MTFIKIFAVTLILVLLSQACGRKEKPKSSTLSEEVQSKLKAKADLYLSLSPSVQDADGFIEWDHCDSLLFSSLYAVGGGKVDIPAARDSDGMWHRRSLNQPECYNEADGATASSISRDMLIGLLWYIWRAKRLDLANDLFDYGVSHDWIMGKGDASRIYFTPGLQATLAEIIHRLGGTDHSAYRAIPQAYSKNVGFAAHLDILHILLRAELVGHMDQAALDIVKYNYDRSPQNALFAYAWHRYSDADQTETVNALLNEKWFPADRLPTSSDRCESWLFQRDPGKDWEPCDEGRTHSGGDYLFVTKLLLGS